jgi:hypothetical protein
MVRITHNKNSSTNVKPIQSSLKSGDYKSIDDFVKEKFMTVAKKYDLNYVTD